MKFNPNYTLSLSLAKELLEIERHKEAINILPVTATLIASLWETARLISTHYSTQIEGKELKPWQIMEFIEYQNEVRPIIQDKIKNHSEQLFNSNARFNAIIYHIFKKLKKYNQKVENIKQIRASVITNWLGNYNLRKVPYFAGHRYISSTEGYLQDDLENLHEIVNNFHSIN